MHILKEFLESSTIHGLTYIASAKVSLRVTFILSFLILDKVCKTSLALCCFRWICRGRNSDWQVLQGVAWESHRHLDHHPSHRWPGLPQGDHLSSKRLQHCPVPRSCESWHWKSLWWKPKNTEKSCLWDFHGADPQGVYQKYDGYLTHGERTPGPSRISLLTIYLQQC